MHQLAMKGVEWEWNLAAQVAFDKMKTGLTTTPVPGFSHPRHCYVLDTDGSEVDVGVVLSQVQDCEEWFIAYFNETPTPPE